MSDLQEQLKKWRDNQPQPSKQPSVLFKTTTRHNAKHGLKTYKGIVEFPHTRGGGVMWMKSTATLNSYANKGYKVVWL